jgi:hypothetical protein
MLVFDVVTILIVCSKISGCAGWKLHILLEVNTECI